nr:hypothetical protein [Candidatus Halobonum tyrrellensis]
MLAGTVRLGGGVEENLLVDGVHRELISRHRVGHQRQRHALAVGDGERHARGAVVAFDDVAVLDGRPDGLVGPRGVLLADGLARLAEREPQQAVLVGVQPLLAEFVDGLTRDEVDLVVGVVRPRVVAAVAGLCGVVTRLREREVVRVAVVDPEGLVAEPVAVGVRTRLAVARPRLVDVVVAAVAVAVDDVLAGPRGDVPRVVPRDGVAERLVGGHGDPVVVDEVRLASDARSLGVE